MAANEERIQSSRSSAASRPSGASRGASTSRQPVTSSLLSSALASAGISRHSEGLFKGVNLNCHLKDWCTVGLNLVLLNKKNAKIAVRYGHQWLHIYDFI